MKETLDFRIRETSDANRERLPRCTVQRDSSSVELHGNTLEVQFLTSAGEYLLVLSDDRPFEETLRIYLLDRNSAILDSLMIGPPYQSLILKNTTVQPNDQVLLTVNDEQHFLLAVRAAPIGLAERLRLKLKGVRIGKQRRILFSIH